METAGRGRPSGRSTQSPLLRIFVKQAPATTIFVLPCPLGHTRRLDNWHSVPPPPTRSASPSQQCPDAVQLAVRHAQALPELHATCSAACLNPELLYPRREQLRAMPGSRLRAISRMAKVADFDVPPAGAFAYFDFDLHRRAPCSMHRVTTPRGRPEPTARCSGWRPHARSSPSLPGSSSGSGRRAARGRGGKQGAILKAGHRAGHKRFLKPCFYWSERRDLNSGPLAPHGIHRCNSLQRFALLCAHQSL